MKAIITWLQNQKAGIVFLQETFSTKEVENFWSSQWDSTLFFAHGTEHTRGVLVLVQKHLEFLFKNFTYNQWHLSRPSGK